MKKVFKITVQEKENIEYKKSYEQFVFAEDISEAVKKVENCWDESMQVVRSELICDVQEDKDLERYKE